MTVPTQYGLHLFPDVNKKACPSVWTDGHDRGNHDRMPRLSPWRLHARTLEPISPT
jgi:hypothetical protein